MLVWNIYSNYLAELLDTITKIKSYQNWKIGVYEIKSAFGNIYNCLDQLYYIVNFLG